MRFWWNCYRIYRWEVANIKRDEERLGERIERLGFLAWMKTRHRCGDFK